MSSSPSLEWPRKDEPFLPPPGDRVSVSSWDGPPVLSSPQWNRPMLGPQPHCPADINPTLGKAFFPPCARVLSSASLSSRYSCYQHKSVPTIPARFPHNSPMITTSHLWVLAAPGWLTCHTCPKALGLPASSVGIGHFLLADLGLVYLGIGFCISWGTVYASITKRTPRNSDLKNIVFSLSCNIDITRG